jgi:hypothetical protein
VLFISTTVRVNDLDARVAEAEILKFLFDRCLIARQKAFGSWDLRARSLLQR